jgi:hypothetical protein
MLVPVKIPTISALGRLWTPAVVRRRRARAVAVGGGAGSLSRLTREEAIRLAAGPFKDYPGPSADEAKRMDREEERRAEERKFGPDPG